MSSKSRFTFLVAVHLFLIKDNQVLLLQRKNTGYEDGNYSVPAGHVDGGEKATVAMLREAQEEVGLDLDYDQLEMKHVMHRIKPDEQHERIDFFYVATEWDGQPTNAEPHKCDHLEWFRVDDLPGNTISYVHFALKKVQQGQVFSEFVK